jgi:hypothetical protein
MFSMDDGRLSKATNIGRAIETSIKREESGVDEQALKHYTNTSRMCKGANGGASTHHQRQGMEGRLGTNGRGAIIAC